jgi:indolepyruvate ferredoxin oxidoreductase beta subunit
MEYPKDILQQLKSSFKDVLVVNATVLALKAGNLKAVNTVMLGVVSRFLDVSESIWENVLRKSFPEKLIGINVEAFRLGKEAS